MKKYAVVIEKTGAGYSAYVPDLPGCVTTGKTREETGRLIRDAIELHIKRLRQHGERVPEPTTLTEYVEVAAR
jgi:predicted RNase H-like HicB family nuclease